MVASLAGLRLEAKAVHASFRAGSWRRGVLASFPFDHDLVIGQCTATWPRPFGVGGETALTEQTEDYTMSMTSPSPKQGLSLTQLQQDLAKAHEAMALLTAQAEQSMARERALADQLAKAKASRSPTPSFKVSEKRAVSVYGMGRFPLTAYASQWLKILDMADQLRAFIEANRQDLSWGKADQQ